MKVGKLPALPAAENGVLALLDMVVGRNGKSP
jgi:hypothetical protein